MKINLLPQLSVSEVKAIRKKKTLELVSVLGLVIGIVGVLAVFGYWAMLNNEVRLVEEKIGQAEEEVNQLVDRESLLRGYKEKLAFLTPIVSQRPRFDSLLTDLYSLSPEGVSFLEANLQEEKVIVSGRAASRVELNKLIDRLKESQTLADQKIEKVTLASLVKEPEGDYKFTVQLSLNNLKK